MLPRTSTLLIYIAQLLFLISCNSQKEIYHSQKIESALITGKYKSEDGKELLSINANGTFICLRQHIQNFDVLVPVCDTMTAGFWEMRRGFLILKNKAEFNNLIYEVGEYTIDTKDSLKFKVSLPAEDALNYNVFRFIVTSSYFNKVYNEFDNPKFSIKTNGSLDGLSFDFSIKNTALVTNYGKKSYQRPYFYVFQNYIPKNKNSNYFTITVKNFNQCFYEAMEVDNEIVGLEAGKLFWRGNVYKKM